MSTRHTDDQGILDGQHRAAAVDDARREAYDQGRDDAIESLMTADQAAAQLGIKRSRVGQIARRMGIGIAIGVDRLFLPEHVEEMRAQRGKRRPKDTTDA